MTMALGALEGRAQPGQSGCIDPVDHLIYTVCLGMHARLDVTGRCPVKPGGNFLGDGGLGQKVTGNLLDCKLIKGHVRIHGLYHPVTECPAIAQLIGLEAIKKRGGLGIPIFKPREYNLDIIKRFKAAEDAGALAVGIDIDAASFKTMTLKGQAVGPKSISELQELKSHLKVPFILKGIMNAESALAAIEAGADAIVVSNHGGRVMDHMPGTAEVLPEIVHAVAGRVKVLVDGGVREGVDILKMLALGADAVMIGRPVCIAAFGAGQEGVSFYLREKMNELKKAMILTGCGSIPNIDPSIIFRKKEDR